MAGRIRVRLAKRLREIGIAVSPDDLVLNRDRCYDVARWNGEGARLLPPLKEAGLRIDLYCWDKMSDCARSGCVLGNRDLCLLEIHVAGESA